jgi:beta-mannanase
MEPWMGLYLPEDMDSTLRKTHDYTKLLGQRIQALSFYFAWGSEMSHFPITGVQAILRGGYTPMITWEPWKRPHDLPEEARPEEQPDFSLSEILRGRFDDYIVSWALGLKQVESPVFFRPMHEMNGNWYPWGGSVNGNSPEKFIETWRYIRAIFREHHSHQLIWVWSPYAQSVPDQTGNEIWRYYPGGEEVDWLGLDGYNWGETQEWSNWKSFFEIFKEGFKILGQLSMEKPFMIAEMGCAEEGGNKERWIEETFKALKKDFPRVKALVWFNMDKECDWRIESSLESLGAFQKGCKDWLS